MSDSSKTDIAPALRGDFNLAAIMETKARQALGKLFIGDGWELANELAVAKSLNKDSVFAFLGVLKETGDLSQTETFSEYRTKLMEAFPALKDVCFLTEEACHRLPAYAWVDLRLKDPVPGAPKARPR